MKTINANTKAAARFINAYNRSTDYELRHVYGRYSWEKEHADFNCRRQMVDEGGHGYKIISFDTFGFSVAWETAEGLRVETPQSSYLVKVA